MTEHRYGGTQWKPRHVEGEHPRAAAERRIVEQLGNVMREKLAERRKHGEWEGTPVDTLYGRAADEMRELMAALQAWAWEPTAENAEHVRRECGDAGNFLAMIVDVVGEVERFIISGNTVDHAAAAAVVGVADEMLAASNFDCAHGRRGGHMCPHCNGLNGEAER